MLVDRKRTREKVHSQIDIWHHMIINDNLLYTYPNLFELI
jgi:hypothetical protein